MITLKKNDIVGRYTVEHQIKAGIFSSTYRVSDNVGNPCFMKIYDMSAVPAAMVKNDTVYEIVYSRQVKHENVISYIDDGKEVLSDGNTYAYLITNFFTGKLLSEQLASGVIYDPQFKTCQTILHEQLPRYWNILVGVIFGFALLMFIGVSCAFGYVCCYTDIRDEGIMYSGFQKYP